MINKQLKGENEVVLSFSRRLNRPQVGTLNPFVDYSDPLNLRKGNPSLLPEYINSFEFSYNKNWKSYSINSTAYYRTIEGIITRYRTVDNAGIATTTFLKQKTTHSIEWFFLY